MYKGVTSSLFTAQQSRLNYADIKYYMKTFLNLIYYLYIRLITILYQFIRRLSVRDPVYSEFLRDIAIHNKDIITQSEFIKPFKYEVMKHIPFKFLNVLVFTENSTTDILFLMRLYKTIISIPEFIELGKVKIILIYTHGEDIFTIATSFPIKPNTTPEDFVKYFFKNFIRLSLKGYAVETFDVLLVKTITGDKESSNKSIPTTPKRAKMPFLGSGSIITNKHDNYLGIRRYSSTPPPISQTNPPGNKVNRDPRRYILPLQAKEKQMTKIGTFDIETMVVEGRLYPYAIALQYKKYNKIHKIIYYYENIVDSVERNSAIMLEKMVSHIENNCKHYTLFAHNLGKFDGILMMSSMFKVLGPHSVMIGRDNSIISISFKGIKMLDSLRIFPMSLRDLAKQFKVETQKGDFDFTKVTQFNVNDEDLKEEVLKYIEGDISSLYECMVKASDHVFNKYCFNLSDIYSASSMAMKHFRTSYLDSEGIPLLPKHMTDIISQSYYGGISQVYKTRGESLHYYDVNSLYPWAMTQDMPYEYLTISHKTKLKDAFGFIYASIYVPESLKYKPLPIRLENDTIATPSGHIQGVYFSEELKYAESIGCTVIVHRSYLFSRKRIFNDYVKDVYSEKKVATGSDRFFIKLLLNGLYGFFARTDEKYVALFLPLDEAINQAQIYPAYNLILMDDDKTALLIRDVKASKDLCDATDQDYYKNLDINNRNRTKSNRAIASAITAYSRIRTHQFKDILGDVYYSDTDSVISGNKLSDKYLSDDLGMMKDEFKGKSIEKGIFISPKLYGLKVNGKEIIKARGVPAGTINFDDLARILSGEVINFTRTQLFKSIDLLTIFEKEINGTIKLTIPLGKTPIHNDDGDIIAFKDIHRDLFTAIKDNPLRVGISSNVQRLISVYKGRRANKVNSSNIDDE